MMYLYKIISSLVITKKTLLEEQRKREKELREQKLQEEKLEKQREKELKEQQKKAELKEKGMSNRKITQSKCSVVIFVKTSFNRRATEARKRGTRITEEKRARRQRLVGVFFVLT